MNDTYRHYAWPVSPYSAKTRSYLRFKRIPYEEIVPNGYELMRTIKRAVGSAVMPTMQDPQGNWMQDSSEIIDTLESRFAEPSIVPPGPTQRVAALLLELHADEWMPIVMMHTRWNYDKNVRFAETEFGRYAAPFLPEFLSRRLAAPIAKRMSSYRPLLGVRPETIQGIESFGRTLIERLDKHFAAQPFLLGSRPCIADFSLYGPLWAHVLRDPGTTHWFDDAQHVRDWINRLQSVPTGPGEFLGDDEVPETLDPIFSTFFEEHFKFVTDLVAAIDDYCEANPGSKRVPRSLGDHSFVIGGHKGTRRLITFTQWMAQRPLDAYQGLSDAERGSVDAWLERVGGKDAMQLRIKNRFERQRFKMRLAPSAA